MANNRIFYECQAVAFAPCFKAHTSSNTKIAHGLQSVGVTTNFNLEQAFELGQIQIYENIEGLPDVEVTLEKVLDGYPLVYHLASPEATSPNLVGRSKERACVGLGIFDDSKDAVSGAAPVEVYMSGMYLSSLSYTFPVDGNCTESVTLVGNHKEWLTTARLLTSQVVATGQMPIDFSTGRGLDEPASLYGSGGIQRRENIDMSKCIIPRSIIRSLTGESVTSISESAGNNNANGVPKAHIQNVSISTDFGREDILELGRKTPYYRAPNFPIEVTCEIEVISVSGDFVEAIESGRPEFENTRNEGNNTPEEAILIVLDDGSSFNLGTKNRLSSVTYGGGDAGGGNASTTFSYSTFNDLIVSHSGVDPANLNGELG